MYQVKIVEFERDNRGRSGYLMLTRAGTPMGISGERVNLEPSPLKVARDWLVNDWGIDVDKDTFVSTERDADNRITAISIDYGHDGDWDFSPSHIG